MLRSIGKNSPGNPLSQSHTHTHTHPFNGPLFRTTRVSRYQIGKTNVDFTEARDSDWQWRISWTMCKPAPRSREITIRYDTRCYFNVRSKANMSQLNPPHGTDS